MKEYWQIPFLVIWTVLVWVLTRRNTDAMVEVIAAKRDSYKKQVEVLKESHNNELLKRDDLIRQYEETMGKIELEFAKKSKQLSEKQKSDIKEVVAKSKGDHEKIKKRIEEEFKIEFL